MSNSYHSFEFWTERPGWEKWPFVASLRVGEVQIGKAIYASGISRKSSSDKDWVPFQL